MKKIASGIIVTALVLTVGTTAAFAVGRQQGNDAGTKTNQGISAVYSESVTPTSANNLDVKGSDNQGTNCTGAGFVDSDGDGVCDNQGTNCSGAGFVDSDGDGVCDNQGTNCAGTGFVDSDGDGVCDRRENGTAPQDGTGNQWGHHQAAEVGFGHAERAGRHQGH